MNEILFAPASGGHGSAMIKALFWRAVGSCALGGLYPGRFQDHYLRIEHRTMRLPGLGKGLDGARLAHISDLHCSPIVLNRYLTQCVEAVNALNVDFVAVTGDFITGTKFYARRVAKVLRSLNPKVATVACLGNHDYGAFHPKGRGGKAEMGQYMSEQLGYADIFVMLNESRIFRRNGSAIQFVGLEDYWTPYFNPKLAFEYAQRHMPTIALCHNPDPAKEIADSGADWVLSGHTHGTAWNKSKSPFRLMPIHDRNYFAGEYSLGEDKHLYVTRGIGYGRRVNLNSRPEITLFTFRDSPAKRQS